MADTRYIYYIDVGKLPVAKAEEYVAEIIEKFKVRSTLDLNEDMWYIPVRSDGSASRIERIK